MAGNKEYKNISRSDLDTIRKELTKTGIKIPAGDDVEVKGPLGVRMQVVYDESGKSLKLEITDKPFYISESQIWKVIESGAERLA